MDETTPVERLGLPPRAVSALKSAGANTLAEARKIRLDWVDSMPNCGVGGIKAIREIVFGQPSVETQVAVLQRRVEDLSKQARS